MRESWFGEHLLHPTSFKASLVFSLFVLSQATQPWSAMVTAFPGGIQYDVVSGEAREGVSRVRRRPADFGMPGDDVSFQKNAGYTGMRTPARSEGGAKDTEERVYGMVTLTTFFPRQVIKSNALFFSLGHPEAGFLVKSQCA